MSNYWSLYLDFLEDFKDLTYKGYSLAYLCHFRSLVRFIDPLLQDISFEKHIRHSVKERKEVQDEFNQFIQSNTRKLIKNPNGIVVFHDVYNLLRLNEIHALDYCNPSKSMIISEGENKQRAENCRTKQTVKKPRVTVGQVLMINVSKQQPKNQVIKNNVTKSNLRVEYFKNYQVNMKETISKIRQQARSICYKYRKHPLYSNSDFNKSLLKQLSGIINRIEEAEMFLSKTNVSCIVLASTHYYQSRTFAMVAARKGIPTICLQHGIIGSETGYIPRIATVDAVYGQFEIDWYKQLGENENSLEIIGHPRFDQAFKKSSVSRAQFNKKLGLDSTKKTLMLVVRGNQQINRWKLLIDKISKRINVNIVIKDFPSNQTHELTRKYPIVHSVKHYKLYDIFPNVDAVVAYPSTVGLEAMITNKTVFILNHQFNGDTGYYNKLDELVQMDPQKLAPLIIKYFTSNKYKNYTDKKRQEFLTYAYLSNTLSGKRLKMLIEKLTK